jgi:hypothetical protein
MIASFVKFVISVVGGHCNYSLQTPKSLAAPLTCSRDTNITIKYFTLLYFISFHFIPLYQNETFPDN